MSKKVQDTEIGKLIAAAYREYYENQEVSDAEAIDRAIDEYRDDIEYKEGDYERLYRMMLFDAEAAGHYINRPDEYLTDEEIEIVEAYRELFGDDDRTAAETLAFIKIESYLGLYNSVNEAAEELATAWRNRKEKRTGETITDEQYQAAVKEEAKNLKITENGHVFFNPF